MLNNRDKKVLKKKAHHLKAKFQVGKDGLSDNLLISLDEYLYVYELVKVNVLQNAPFNAKDIAADLSDNGYEIVEVKGRTIVVYRFSNNHNKKSQANL